jgi:hypothetical protein
VVLRGCPLCLLSLAGMASFVLSALVSVSPLLTGMVTQALLLVELQSIVDLKMSQKP